MSGLWIFLKWIGRVFAYYWLTSLVIVTIDQYLFGPLRPPLTLFTGVRAAIYFVGIGILPLVVATRNAMSEIRDKKPIPPTNTYLTTKQETAAAVPVHSRSRMGQMLAFLVGAVLLLGCGVMTTLFGYSLLFPNDSGVAQMRAQLQSLASAPPSPLPSPMELNNSEPPPTVPPPSRTPRSTTTPRPRPTATTAPVNRVTIAEIITSRLNVRAHPNTEAEIWATATQGDRFIVVGENRDGSWLAVWYPDKGYAWVSGSDQYVSQSKEEVSDRDFSYYETGVALFTAPSRPTTGVMSASRNMSGLGELLIQNGSEQDSIAVLSPRNDEPLIAVYIRKGDNYNITGIPIGEYALYFMSGDGWQTGPGKFKSKASLYRFEEIFDFTETDEIDGDFINTVYTTYEVTLYGVIGGTASTPSVAESDFPPIP